MENSEQLPNSTTNLLNQQPESQLFHIQSESGNIFQVSGAVGDTTRLRFEWTKRHAEFDNEVGLFTLEDDQGRINGIAPGEAGYAQAALNSPTRQVLFSSGKKTGSWQELDLNGGDYLGFYLIQNSTTQEWLAGNPGNDTDLEPLIFFSLNDANPDGFDHVNAQDLGLGVQELSWEDETDGGDKDFNDVIFTVSQPHTLVPGEEGQTTPTQVALVSSESLYSNEMGVFLVDNPQGYIGDLAPGDAGYAAAALSSERSQVIFSQGETVGKVADLELPAGSYLGWYLIQNASTEQFLAENPTNNLQENGSPVAFFSYPEANPDGISHAHHHGNNQLAWEDLTGGGDYDYNDIVFHFEFNPSTGGDILLTEGTNFQVFHEQELEIPSEPSILSFTYTDLNFDTTDPDFINDAFEVALVDIQGNSLVHTIGDGLNAFFNLTEGQSPNLAPGVTVTGQTVSLNLAGVEPGTQAKLILRLVNDDSDITTSVRITDINFQATELTPISGITPEIASSALSTDEINFDLLEDVSPSLVAEYQQTSLNQETQVLSAQLAVRNTGSYEVDTPLFVAIDRISDPTIQVGNADGITPEGLPYYDFSHLVADGSLSPGELTQAKELTFLNPQGVQFTYEVVVLGYLNQAPTFTSEPDVEALVGRPYSYQAQAVDPDNDTLSYSLLTAPEGMEINSDTGEITWTPAPDGVGNYSVAVQVVDNRGGVDTQEFVVAAIDAPPNRPPVFTSTPVVDAKISGEYVYQATAIDADGDTLTYSLVDAPEGMEIDSDTGEITWTPTAAQVGETEVRLQVEDGQGGIARQIFPVLVQPDLENYPPVIISEPESLVTNNELEYTYQVKAIDPDKDELTYSLAENPNGMVINSDTGLISWGGTAKEIGEHTVVVQVTDGRGGVDTQEFVVEVTDNALAKIEGTKWNDLNGNGFRDTEFVQGNDPDVVFVVDVSGSADFAFAGTSIGDFNGDGVNDTRLDAEIAGFLALNNQLINQGLGEIAQVGIVVFSGFAAQADMDLTTEGLQIVTTPTADRNEDGVADIEEILRSINSGAFGVGNFTGTNFEVALQSAEDIFNNLGTASGDGNLIFLSDGGANQGSFIGDELERLRNLDINLSAFGVGEDASLVQLNEIDSDAQIFTSTDELLDVFGGLNGNERFLEPGLAGVTIYLDLNNNGFLDSGEPTQVTAVDNPDTPDIDETGEYRFTGLLPGDYTVRELVPRGFTQTFPGGENGYVVDLEEEEVVENLNFGNQPLEGVITNEAPNFTSEPPTTAQIGELLRYQVTATDPDNDILLYDLPVKPEGMAVDATTGILIWQPKSEQVGTFDVILRVKDPFDGVALQVFQVSVDAANTPPIITSQPPIQAISNRPYEYRVRAQDAEADKITFRLEDAPEGMAIDSETGVISYTPTPEQLGSQSVIVAAIDSEGGETTQEYSLSVVTNAPNALPEITSTPRTRIRLGNTYYYLVEAQDSNGDPLSFSLETAPQGMTIDENGLITWKPASEQFGANNVTLQVADGRGEPVTQTFTIEVVSQNSNLDPTIDSEPVLTATANRVYEYNIITSDPDGDPVSLSLTTAPLGMSIDERSGTVRWQPRADQIGDHEVVIEGIDGQGGIVSQAFTLNVRGVNLPPAITSTPPTIAAFNRNYTYQVEAKDPENDTLTYALVNNSPQGMSINEETGLITWTPTAEQIGSQRVEILVSDGQGGVNIQTYGLAVLENAPNQLPVITSEAVRGANPGELYQYNVTASDPEGTPISFSLLEQPQGMTIDTNTGEIQWQTNPNQSGEFTVTVVATDGDGGRAIQSFSVEVSVNNAPVITSEPLVNAVPGFTYRYDIQANDPNGDRLKYTLIQAPEGMQVDQLGRVTWTPDADDTGSYQVELQVADGRGGIANQTYQVTLGSDVTAPEVELGFSSNVIEIGDSVDFQLLATDNVGVETLDLLVDGTPESIDPEQFVRGQIHTATVEFKQAGVYEVQGKATDAAGNVGTESLEVRVIDPDDTEAPFVEIDDSVFKESGTYVVSLTDIMGTVRDDDLEFYRVEYAPINLVNLDNLAESDPDYVTIAQGNSNVEDGLLGQLDPKLVANGNYLVRVIAGDLNGNINSRGLILSVGGENFQTGG